MADYSTGQAARAAGITYRQADYWARVQFVQRVQPERVGSGQQRRWNLDEVFELAVLAAATHVGVAPSLVSRVMPEILESGDFGTDEVSVVFDLAALRAQVEASLGLAAGTVGAS